MKRILLAFSFLISQLSLIPAGAQAPAFPGAEGHGRYTAGGRGGKIVHVTNLNNSGAGSFRQAVSGDDKKIVVFDVGGIIALESDVNIGANTTILGQTAPAPGITLRYYTVQPKANSIIRFIRSRRGEERNVNDGADAIWQRNITGLILDHCSFSWSIDEVASFYDNNNFTMQWCTIAESLVHPGHSKGPHGYGGIGGGKLASFHHNLIAHVANRAPRFNGARYNWTGYTSNKLYSDYDWKNAVQAEIVDFRNCIVFNCGNGCYGGPGGGQINMVNNYYKSGQVSTSIITTASVANITSSSDNKTYWNMFSRYYINGNQLNTTANADWGKVKYDDGSYAINGEPCTPDPNHYYGDNVTYVKNSAGTDCVSMKLTEPAPKGVVTTHSAAQAYEKVLCYAGASFSRDAVDIRYEAETRSGKATYKGSATSYVKDGKTYSCTPTYGRIDKVSDVGGYELESTAHDAGFDSDNDGMSDAWETANGLDPNNAADAQLYTLDPKKYYTNIEVYANSLVQDIMLNGNADAIESVEEYYPAYTKEDGTKVEAINGPDGGGNVEPTEGSIDGDITWPMSEGTSQPSYSFSSSISDFLEVPTMSVGSHLKVNGIQKTDFDMTLFTITDENSDTGATETNAVKFNITPKEGNVFQPTHVSFNATRFGTDHGMFQAYWLYDDGTRIEVASEQLANRNNASPKYTTISEDVQGKATSGTSSLVIHLYDIPYNTNTKNMGLANVTISGKAASTQTGISNHATVPASTVYYNLQGMRVAKPSSGTYIRIEQMSDGTTRSRKITR